MSKDISAVDALSPTAKELLAWKGPGLAAWRSRRHCLDTTTTTKDELAAVLATAAICRQVMDRQEPPLTILANKIVANLFYENSTRTKSSFELAARRLGATVINLDINTSSVAKGETLIDTAATLIAMGANALVQRHADSGSAHLLAESLGRQAHIINAGDGLHAHPSQGFLDHLTLVDELGDLKNKKIAIVGDLSHSRVARSNIALLNLVGADVHVCAPPTLMPADIASLQVKYHINLEAAIENADIVMVLRMQLERQSQGLIPSIGEYKKLYRMDHNRLKLAKPGAKVMHPGPVNRGVEITHEIADDERVSLLRTQVRNGVAVRMAILYLLLYNSEA